MNPQVFLAVNRRGLVRAECRSGQWTVTELLSGHTMACLAADPRRPNVIYAGSHDAGLLRSDDQGRTWQAAGMEGQIVKSLAISPHDPEVVYAGTKPALMFRSDDGGSTWRELDGFRRIPNRWWWFSPAEPPDRRPYVLAIAPSPTEPGVVLAGVEFGAVVRSTDGGQSWSRHLRGALRDCHSLKFHAGDGRWAYEAGGTGGGAAFSRDGGRTWKKAGRGLAKHYGITCAADPERPEIWYVCAGRSPMNAFGQNPEVYLYRSTGGAGWQPIGWEPHPLRATPTALVTLPGAPGHLYAGLKNGAVWQSTDYGDTWQPLPVNLGQIWFSMLVL